MRKLEPHPKLWRVYTKRGKLLGEYHTYLEATAAASAVVVWPDEAIEELNDLGRQEKSA